MTVMFKKSVLLVGTLLLTSSVLYAQPGQQAQRPAAPQSYPLEDARERLRRLLPDLGRWTPLAGVAPMGSPTAGPSRASYVASTLSASLELIREGELEARQMPLRLRSSEVISSSRDGSRRSTR